MHENASDTEKDRNGYSPVREIWFIIEKIGEEQKEIGYE